ncbi:MAG: hypothetical protein VB858_15205 [Planctomycetaceae bacterium]
MSLRRDPHRSGNPRSGIWTVVAMTMWWAVFPVTGFAATKSVQQFLAQKENWKASSRISIEGRVSIMKGKTLILQKCSRMIDFRSDRVLPEATGGSVVEVVGGLVRDEKTGVFHVQVTSVRLLPSDVQRVQIQRNKLPRNEVAPWYALGEWATHRADYYGKTNDPLYSEAAILFKLAVLKERRLLEPATPENLRALAVKSERYGVESSIGTSFVHASYNLEWQQNRLKATAEELLGLATSVASALPGAGDPVASQIDVKELRKRYQNDPLKLYEDSDVEVIRHRLHRLLYQQIVEKAILEKEEPDGRNGKIIAKIITDYLPERIAEVTAYQAEERNWRLKNVQTFPRSEMIKLRGEFLDIDDRDSAAQALEKWFSRKETELRIRGVDGLLDLATEYEIRYDLVDNEQEKDRIQKKIVMLLMDAYRKNPGFGTTSSRLEELGYRLRDGVWRTPTEMKRFHSAPRQRAMAEGRIVRGMTDVEVVKALGKPDRVCRILTARNVIELWAFGKADESILVVRLIRSGNRKVSVVTDWKQIRQISAQPQTELESGSVDSVLPEPKSE